VASAVGSIVPAPSYTPGTWGVSSVAVNFSPHIGLKIQRPHVTIVVKLVQRRVLATEDKHIFLEDHRLVGTAGRWRVERLDELPFVTFNVPAKQFIEDSGALAVARLATKKEHFAV
jgi:hypothetical protein